MKTQTRILRLFIALYCVFTKVLAQEYILQVSPDSSHLNSFPQVQVNNNGKVWVSYISDDARFIAGYVQGATWHETANIDVPFPITSLGNELSAMVNETEQAWFAALDASNRGRIGFVDSNKWNEVDTVLDIWKNFGLFPNKDNGPCYFFDGYVTKINIRRMVDGLIQSTSRTIDDLDKFWNEPDIFFLHPICLPNDSITFTMGYFYNRGILGAPYRMGTFVNNSSSGSVFELEGGDSGPAGHPPYIGAYPLCSSAIGTRSFVISRYQSPPTYARYSAFIADTTVRRVWRNVIAEVDVDSSKHSSFGIAQCFKIAASNFDKCIVLAWISNDTLRLKILRDTVWSLSAAIVTANQSLLRQLSVAIASDTTIYVSYAALTNGKYHIFLSKVHLPFVIDTVLTNVHTGFEQTIPTGYSLEQNYPNPFNPTTTIEFSVPYTSFTTLRIFDLLGKNVATLVSKELCPARYSVNWDAANFPTGVYFCRFESGDFGQTRKLLLLK